MELTICGFAKTRDGAAYLWGDGEIYRHGSAIGETMKVTISKAGIAGVATGYDTMCQHFSDLLRCFGASPIGEVAARLPAMLRAALAEKQKALRDLGMFERTTTTFAIVGWAGSDMLGLVFYQNRNFEATESDAWYSPNVDAWPESAEDVLVVAQAQIAIVRQTNPAATGLDLTIAKVGVGKAVTTTVPLLVAEERAALHARV